MKPLYYLVIAITFGCSSPHESLHGEWKLIIDNHNAISPITDSLSTPFEIGSVMSIDPEKDHIHFPNKWFNSGNGKLYGGWGGSDHYSIDSDFAGLYKKGNIKFYPNRDSLKANVFIGVLNQKTAKSKKANRSLVFVRVNR